MKIQLITVLLLSVLVVACKPEETKKKAGVPGAENAEKTSEQVVSGQISAWETLSEQERIPGVSSFQKSNSWEERLGLMSADSQRYLREMNEKYYGSLEFSSMEEQELLIRQGFPSVEEWLFARDMPETKLEVAAEAGNWKAQLLYADRLASRFNAEQISNSTGFDQEQMKLKLDAVKYASLALRGAKNPFSAYLYGGVAEKTSGNPEMAAAAMLLARELGDTRADQLSLAVAKRRPGMNPATIQLAFGSMRDIVALK
ncbi:MAG TPA: hypothetical protein VGE12_08830 [Noviherbaspirillum sp.]